MPLGLSSREGAVPPPPPPPPSPFSHLHYALCGLFGLGLLPWSQRPEGPSHLSSQLSPGPGHPGSTRSHRLWPACQVLARVPGPSEGTRPLSPTLPCLKLDGGDFRARPGCYKRKAAGLLWAAHQVPSRTPL